MTDPILVVGGAGFIGASLVRALDARGERVRVLDWGQAAAFAYLRGTRAEVVEGDVADLSTARRAVEGSRTVVHLAARTSVPASIAAPLDDLEQNVMGTVQLLGACRGAGVERFVFASSNAALGLIDPPAREETPPRPVAPYGAAKLAVEAYLHAYHRSYGLVATALRFSNAYGPYSLHKVSVVAAMTKAYLAGRPLSIYGDGSQTRDFVHVDDLVALVLLAIEAPREQVAGEVFQAGTGRETSVAELARELLRAGRLPGTIEHLPPRHGDVARSFSDVSKAERVLGYRPSVALSDGLRSTIHWFEEALADPLLAPMAQAKAVSGSD